MSDPLDPERLHLTMTNVAAHEQCFAGLSVELQTRHLQLHHGVPADRHEAELALLRRDYPDRYTVREPTLADVHEWWHIRQRDQVDRQNWRGDDR